MAIAAGGGQTFVIVEVGGNVGKEAVVEGGKVGGGGTAGGHGGMGVGGMGVEVESPGAGGDVGRAGVDRVIGMTRVYDVDWRVRKATIGYTWYIPAVWGKVHNKECKLLLLQYIFGRLGFVRVEFKVASQNLRSQKAVTKIGGVKEAVLRKYTLRNDGTPSDTVIFSILDEEWPGKKEKLLQLIAGL
jgi:Acetyltransferase (GNAT) domain